MTDRHPRDVAVEAAGKEFQEYLQDFRARHALTAFEYLFILTTLAGRTVTALCLAEREGIKSPSAV